MNDTMTEQEILTTYRQAPDKKKQIGVTAEVCGMSKTEVVDFLLAHGEEVPPQVKGGVIGGKSEAHKGPRKKPEPKPDPKPAADVLVIEGAALRYLRCLARELDNGIDVKTQFADLVVFLLLEDGGAAHG